MNENFKTFFVVNPNSANGKTKEFFYSMLSEIKEKLPDSEYAFTEKPLHAVSLTRNALKNGFEMIVSVGGDGTNNEVINGMFEHDGKLINPDAVFFQLPSGTGGDFRKTLNLPMDLDKLLKRLMERNTRSIDVGKLEFISHSGEKVIRYFINITSFGISGLVDYYVNTTTKILGGKASFFIGSLRGMLKYKNSPVKLSVDGKEVYSGKTNLVAVANGKFFGGGMMIAPDANVSDGKFDIVIFGDLSKIEFLSLSQDIYKGTHLENPKIQRLYGCEVVAETETPLLLDVDGEQPGKTPCKITILKNMLKIKE